MHMKTACAVIQAEFCSAVRVCRATRIVVPHLVRPTALLVAIFDRPLLADSYQTNSHVAPYFSLSCRGSHTISPSTPLRRPFSAVHERNSQTKSYLAPYFSLSCRAAKSSRPSMRLRRPSSTVQERSREVHC